MANPLESDVLDHSLTRLLRNQDGDKEALGIVPDGGKVEIMTDSQYIQRGATDWLPGSLAVSHRGIEDGQVRSRVHRFVVLEYLCSRTV